MAPKPIAPQPGPQTRFSESPADICVFGGQAGGGKSWILCYEAAKWNHVPGYGAILFRRDSTQLEGPGGLWEKARQLYKPMGGRLVESPTLVASWETETTEKGLSGAEIHFRHLVHEWTVEDHDGKEYAYVGFDEGQYFTEKMLWYMWGRCRTLCGVTPYMRITCNPDPDCYLRELLDWWIDPDTGYPIEARDGVIRWAIRIDDALRWFDSEAEAQLAVDDIKAANPDNVEIKHIKPISIQFIRSRLEDNPALLAEDPNYGSRLAMQGADDRAKKLGGNWNARPKPGEMFDRTWFKIVDQRPDPSQILLSVRGWDKAATLPSERNPDPDHTQGALFDYCKNGMIYMSDLVSCRLPPGGVDALVYATAQQDGPDVVQAFWIDPGQAGKVDELHITELLSELPCRVSFEAATKNKIAYAKPWSAFADPRAGVERIYLVRGPWNKAFLGEVEKFPKPSGEKGKGVHDDIVDACSRCFVEVQKLFGSTPRKLIDAMSKLQSGVRSYFT